MSEMTKRVGDDEGVFTVIIDVIIFGLGLSTRSYSSLRRRVPMHRLLDVFR